MPDHVVKRVEEIAKENKVEEGLVFRDRMGAPMEGEVGPDPTIEDDDPQDLINADNVGDADAEADGIEPEEENQAEVLTEFIPIDEAEAEAQEGTVLDADDTTLVNKSGASPNHRSDKGVEVHTAAVTLTEQHFTFGPQVGWEKGIKMYKEKGEDAIREEFLQLHNRNAFIPVHWYQLDHEQRKEALNSLCFLKEKRDGTIKGRTCADGRKLRLKATKGEAASPAVAEDMSNAGHCWLWWDASGC